MLRLTMASSKLVRFLSPKFHLAKLAVN